MSVIRRYFAANKGNKVKPVSVNVRSVVNAGSIRREKRNGRELLILPSATLPDNIVMNDILYTAEEIANSFMSLERTPAPLGHPMVNGNFISARDPEGINISYIGAWNENVRRQSGRVHLDKVVDIEFASRTENGRRLLDAVEKEEPIHTSTGLLCDLYEMPEGSLAKYAARNIVFDHDAILLDEEGAGTPEDGVGMFVNSSGNKIEVVNSSAEEAMRDIEWAAESALRAVERMERAPLVDRIVSTILEAVGLGIVEKQSNQRGEDMDEKKLNEIAEKVGNLSDEFSKMPEKIANAMAEALKPVTEGFAQIQANHKAQEEAERQELSNKIVEAGFLSEEDVKDIPLAALRNMSAKLAKGAAAGLSNSRGSGDPDEWSGYDLNSLIDGDDAAKSKKEAN